jgi:GDP-4-dehydro-6-deoxy-D-mannose reductase
VLVSERGAPGGVYNVCNGGRATLQTLLSLLQSLSRAPFTPVTDPSRLRPADDPRILGDNSRLRALGYAPRFSLADTVAATLQYWRSSAAP